MLKVMLIVYSSSGFVDQLATPSMSKCMELLARMKMIDFSLPVSERLSYECKYRFKKKQPTLVAG